jgi:LmbE family N-acetylglucosaminyl deacetylase
MIAPHPDDESLACGVVLQRAARVAAALRVVYATDGEDNPWPQRLIARKWKLNDVDRSKWGKLRRSEALAALREFGVCQSHAEFLGLPDQKLTTLLLHNYAATAAMFAEIIREFQPTDLFIPSIADTHPDHNALGVMSRLTLSQLESELPKTKIREYVVHGRSARFFADASTVVQSKEETARKLAGIRCHQTQIRLSRRRFFGYATRPERFLELRERQTSSADGSVQSFSREPDSIRVNLRLAPKAFPATDPSLLVLGRTDSGVCSFALDPKDQANLQALNGSEAVPVGAARSDGNPLTSRIKIATDVFLPTHSIFIKLERRSWFFDEAGWMELPPVTVPDESVVQAAAC